MFTIKDLIEYLREINVFIDYHDDSHLLIGFSPISSTKENTVSWTSSLALDYEKIKSKVVLCPKSLSYPSETDFLLIPVSNPRLIFTKILRKFFPRLSKGTISKHAILGKNCKIGNNVSIGHYSILGDNVEIGDNSIIYNNVVIERNTKIGRNCVIKSGSIIGEEGFGFEKDENEIPLFIPHLAGVTIGDYVEIGSLSTICRGTLEDTVLGNYVKIDDHVHIAHNVIIEERVMIVACAEVSGSVHIKKGSWIAPNCSIIDRVQIGENCLIGIGSLVVKSIKNQSVVKGNLCSIEDREQIN